MLEIVLATRYHKAFNLLEPQDQSSKYTSDFSDGDAWLCQDAWPRSRPTSTRYQYALFATVLKRSFSIEASSIEASSIEASSSEDSRMSQSSAPSVATKNFMEGFLRSE